MTSIDMEALKRALPMPGLLHAIGLSEFAKASCKSPFRTDKTASWGIFRHNGVWLFKDHATGETGDEISLLAIHLGLDARRDFFRLVEEYARLAGVDTCVEKKADHARPDRSGFGPGTKEQLLRLSRLRGFGLAGLIEAQRCGHLLFGLWHGFECFGISDKSGRVLELRRMSGEPFPAVPDAGLSERKSHAVRGSQKRWPVGILEASAFPKIALVEGLPDFLEGHWQAIFEGKKNSVAVVAMLSAAPAISLDALSSFEGKIVRIFPHVDKAGIEGARRWQNQLLAAGACLVDLFDFGGLHQTDGRPVEDLLDFSLCPEGYTGGTGMEVLP